MSTERSNAQILIDHHRGRAERRIAHELNIAPATVAHIVRAAKPVEQYMSASREDLAERNGRILARYLEGATRKEIAQKFGVTINAANMLIMKAGVAQGRKPVNNPIVIERNTQIVQRYLEGATRKEIAQKFGVTIGTVSMAISKAGVAQGRNCKSTHRIHLTPIV
jgi:DNA-binding CsgD family transcriptional regulator